ncbi:hypothetical protein ACEPPN_000916 [Leptodophora sp. 'Broadleaf-Isolate-01']
MQQSSQSRSSLVAKIASSRVSRCRLNIVLLASVMALVWGFFFWEVYFFSNPNSAHIDDQLPLLPHHALPHVERPQISQELDLGHLIRFTHTPIIEYTRRVIKTAHFQGERPELTRINQRLLGPWIHVGRAELSAVAIPQTATLVVEVPRLSKADTSIFSFGMATTVPRMQDSLPGISHWLSHSKVQLHILAPADDNAAMLEVRMRKASMNVTIHADEASFAQRYVSLIKKLYEERSAKTRWLVLADDDTFFPVCTSHTYSLYD